MAFLITYPKEKVSTEFQRALATVTTPLYMSLRELVASQLTPSEVAQIAQAENIVITSPFALQLYLGQYWQDQRQPHYYVLSQRMADQLRRRGATQVHQSQSENQASLAQLVQHSTNAPVLWLTGNRHVKQNRLSALVNVHQMICYKNTWSQQKENEIVAALQGQTINRVLVTSPSSYTRLRVIESRLSKVFSSVTYYTLGDSTFTEINKFSHDVVKPVNRQHVLGQMLMKMCNDERADQ
ncbi:uroporphyrinogen-III synthase [Secundilactobacillus paracollinoides]|uniref:uroporphyrinogen-III synthase n=1 Tax=Secundilactobacillus paracollinoides TaxID=240427 RepID=UPI0006D262FC|nr:uroporphyrinogen-III synthase [Secundilactobacillus paracollinoides]KRL76103.1 hypothetical protein FC17_GL002154 [Secundilactobacillus paracollinoides DSM 15502 = JCM 11969]